MNRPTTSFLLTLLAAGALAAPVFAVTSVYDELVSLSAPDSGIYRAPLVAWGDPVLTPSSAAIQKIFAMPSGQLLAISSAEIGPPPFPIRTTLNELRPDGTLRLIGEVPGHGTTPTATVLDMDVDQRGRFYLVIRYYPLEPYNSILTRLIEVDPATGAAIRLAPIENLDAVATALDGLWALQAGALRKLDPDSFELGPVVVELEAGASNLEADSAGDLLYLKSCTPICFQVGHFNPRSGVLSVIYTHLYSPLTVSAFTIDRRCYESDTARCLQGGRFRAEVDYRAYDGAAGAAIVAPARSRDTGIFYFFRPDNWELMVKVLDGCSLNRSYWVYAAASTDVEYSMTVTDTETGAQKFIPTRSATSPRR